MVQKLAVVRSEEGLKGGVYCPLSIFWFWQNGFTSNMVLLFQSFILYNLCTTQVINVASEYDFA